MEGIMRKVKQLPEEYTEDQGLNFYRNSTGILFFDLDEEEKDVLEYQKTHNEVLLERIYRRRKPSFLSFRRKVWAENADHLEIDSICHLVLMECIKTYDQSKGRFHSYFCGCIFRRLISYNMVLTGYSPTVEDNKIRKCKHVLRGKKRVPSWFTFSMDKFLEDTEKNETLQDLIKAEPTEAPFIKEDLNTMILVVTSDYRTIKYLRELLDCGGDTFRYWKSQKKFYKNRSSFKYAADYIYKKLHDIQNTYTRSQLREMMLEGKRLE
jgi:hypothetical protein